MKFLFFAFSVMFLFYGCSHHSQYIDSPSEYELRALEGNIQTYRCIYQWKKSQFWITLDITGDEKKYHGGDAMFKGATPCSFFQKSIEKNPYTEIKVIKNEIVSLKIGEIQFYIYERWLAGIKFQTLFELIMSLIFLLFIIPSHIVKDFIRIKPITSTAIICTVCILAIIY